jgi:hypothetical protein
MSSKTERVACCECRTSAFVQTAFVKRKLWHLPPPGWLVRNSCPSGDGNLYYICGGCAVKLGVEYERNSDSVRGVELQEKLRKSAACSGARVGLVQASVGRENRLEMRRALGRK